MSLINKKIYSPAKLNLFLDIKNKRSDGYHELTNIMQAIDFFDAIDISINNKPNNITINTNNPEIPTDSKNLIWKAIEKFYELSKKQNPGITISLNKQIPIGAGLGGGSSNAINVLKHLNFAYNNILDFNQLEIIANSIGSDTNFFLTLNTYLFEGRGEIRRKELNSNKWCYNLIFPDFSCSTKKVYDNYILNLTKSTSKPSLLEFEKVISKNNVKVFERYIYNNLKEAIIKAYPRLNEIIIDLEKITSKKVFISGSGSTLFLINDSLNNAYMHKKLIEKKNKHNLKTIIANTLE